MSLKVIKAGILDTVQDLGRWGHQHSGINPGGVMDRFSAQLANGLLGKEAQSALLELHFPASTFLFQQPTVICITGADFTPTINEKNIPLCQPLYIGAGSVLRFAQHRKGARCYVSFLNNIQVNQWLQSYSTNLKASAGGYLGRSLKSGNELLFDKILNNNATRNESVIALPWKVKEPTTGNQFRFLRGPEWNCLTQESKNHLQNSSFIVSHASDRMAYRLNGPSLFLSSEADLLSSAVCFGTVQLLPNGQLVVLMADHQTTGGYPRIANIITADLPGLAQKVPGKLLGLLLTDLETAEEAFITQQKYLQQIKNECTFKMQNWLHEHRS
jgi:antagonist of KipI